MECVSRLRQYLNERKRGNVNDRSERTLFQNSPTWYIVSLVDFPKIKKNQKNWIDALVKA